MTLKESKKEKTNIDYILYLKFKSSIGNFDFKGRFQKILYAISGNSVEILYQFSKKDCSPGNIGEFEEIQKIKGVGTFLDILSLSTEIMTSCDYDGYNFKVDKELRKEFYNNKDLNLRTFLPKLPPNLNHLSYDAFPAVIDESSRDTHNPDTIELFRYLLECFEKYDFKDSKILSLLNYWRKGLLLEHFGFYEESFLNFYKIIEYFTGRNSFSLSMTDDEKINILNEVFVRKFGINHNEGLAKIILEIMEIRNNWDVAHSKIKKTNNIENRNLFFNITVHDNIWQYNDFIKEISRFFILRHLNFTNLQLINDGGLFHLDFAEKNNDNLS
ncbi:MAG: hypothetical protein PHW24_00595 [Candidatus Moranbacteria bacterium]|nr:hypothetical protein [Candidatus Moranbacteria bacterium]